MDEYEKPYFLLFNRITNLIRFLQGGGEKAEALQALIRMQQDAEELFVGQDFTNGRE